MPARAAGDGRELDVTIVRPRTILGHGRLGIFGILFDWVADGKDPIVLGDGSNRYQFVHADDLASACLLAAARPGPAVFNVGTDRFGTMAEALTHLCAHAGTGARVRRVPARPAQWAMKASAAVGLSPFAPYHWLMYAPLDVVRHRPRPRRPRLGAAVVERRDARPELRLVLRPPGSTSTPARRRTAAAPGPARSRCSST